NASYRSFIQFGVCWQLALFLPQPIDAQASKLEAEVGIALRHSFVPILTTPVQINQLRSFPSEIKVSEVFAKIKNYPDKIHSSSLHSSASILLLELLLEVSLVSSNTGMRSPQMGLAACCLDFFLPLQAWKGTPPTRATSPCRSRGQTGIWRFRLW